MYLKLGSMEIDQDMDIDSLDDKSIIDIICNSMASATLNSEPEEFDEMSLLEDALRLQKAGVSVVKKTVERYKRYINEIVIWEANDMCCLYIRDMILTFLNDKSLKLVDKVKLMRIIDGEIYTIANSV